MRQGYIPVGVCVPELVLGDPTANAEIHSNIISAAAKRETKILVFPELSITGASLGKLFFNRRLMETVEESIVTVAKSTEGSDMIAVFGAPVSVEGRLYDCAVVAGNGHIHGVIPKTNLTGWGHEKIFAPAPEKNGSCIIGGMQIPFGTKLLFESLLIPELCIAVELGEDTNSAPAPSQGHALVGATVIVTPAATVSTAGGAGMLSGTLRELSRRYACAYLRSDAGTEESVSGGMCLSHVAVAENGEIIKEDIHVSRTIVTAEVDVQLLRSEREKRGEFAAACRDGYETVYFNTTPVVTPLKRTVGETPFVWDEGGRDGWCDTIMQMQTDAIVRRVQSTDAGAIVVLLDGGVNSCAAAYAASRAAKALGREPENVICVTCKGPGMTFACANRAMAFAESIKATSAVMDITEQYKQRLSMLGLDENSDPELAGDISHRMRRSIAEDLAEQVGGIVLNTDDMTDWALGRAKTPFGPDSFAVNAGLPKSVMRHLLLRITEQEDDFRQLSNVLRATLVEDNGKCNPGRGQDLKPTEQIRITDLQVNDFCLYYLLKFGFTPNKILRLADRAFAGKVGEVTLYKYVADFFRGFMANRVFHASVPDGPKYLPVDLREGRLNGDFYEDLWESELESMAPEGVEDVDAAAEQEISARDELEKQEREQKNGANEPTPEMLEQMRRAETLAQEQIRREREAEQARGVGVVGKKMDGFEVSPESIKAEPLPDMEKDPMAYFEAMRLKAEEQIRREREAEKE